MNDGQCICDQLEFPCGQSATQEDLLCDGCRGDLAHGFTGDGILSELRRLGLPR